MFTYKVAWEYKIAVPTHMSPKTDLIQKGGFCHSALVFLICVGFTSTTKQTLETNVSKPANVKSEVSASLLFRNSRQLYIQYSHASILPGTLLRWNMLHLWVHHVRIACVIFRLVQREEFPHTMRQWHSVDCDEECEWNQHGEDTLDPVSTL